MFFIKTLPVSLPACALHLPTRISCATSFPTIEVGTALAFKLPDTIQFLNCDGVIDSVNVLGSMSFVSISTYATAPASPLESIASISGGVLLAIRPSNFCAWFDPIPKAPPRTIPSPVV